MSDLFNKLVLRRKGRSCRVAAAPSREQLQPFLAPHLCHSPRNRPVHCSVAGGS